MCRSLPGSTQLDRSTHTWTRFTVVKFFFGTRWLAAVGNPDKKRRKAHLRTQRMRRFRRWSERRVRKPTKKKAETSSPKHHKGFFAAAYIMLFHRHVDEVTWKAQAHSQVAVTRTMEHRRQSNKKGSPTFPHLHVSERTEPRVSQLNGDHATESGLTTQVLLLKSLESNGDRRNYLSSWEENVERRLTVVSEGPARAETRRSRILDNQAICLWIGPLRWAYLASSSASVHASHSFARFPQLARE